MICNSLAAANMSIRRKRMKERMKRLKCKELFTLINSHQRSCSVCESEGLAVIPLHESPASKVDIQCGTNETLYATILFPGGGGLLLTEALFRDDWNLYNGLMTVYKLAIFVIVHVCYRKILSIIFIQKLISQIITKISILNKETASCTLNYTTLK